MDSSKAGVVKQLNWQIRPASADDLLQMQSLDRSSNALSSWKEADFISSLSGRYLTLVAEINSDCELGGFVVASRVGDEGEIMNIAVAMAYRRQGLGRTLLKSVFQKLRSEAVRECFLDVREHNACAIALYQSLGFVECGRRADYYPVADEREDALLMRLNLL